MKKLGLLAFILIQLFAVSAQAYMALPTPESVLHVDFRGGIFEIPQRRDHAYVYIAPGTASHAFDVGSIAFFYDQEANEVQLCSERSIGCDSFEKAVVVEKESFQVATELVNVWKAYEAFYIAEKCQGPTCDKDAPKRLGAVLIQKYDRMMEVAVAARNLRANFVGMDPIVRSQAAKIGLVVQHLQKQ